MLLPRERINFVFPNVSISRDEVELSSLIYAVLYLNLTTAAKNGFTPVHLTSNISTSILFYNKMPFQTLLQHQTCKYSYYADE